MFTKLSIFCGALMVMQPLLAQALPDQGPPSPASLNIKTVYEGLFLPTKYMPGSYRCELGAAVFNAANPPRKSSGWQMFVCEVPFPSMGGRRNAASNVDDWKVVSISDMTLYPTAENAHDVLVYRTYRSSYSRSLGLGHEAVFKPWEEQPWRKTAGPVSKLYDKDHAWDRRSTEGYVRIGRLLFRINIRGSLMIDRVDADTGKGFKSFQGFITIAEAPTCADLEQDLSTFVTAVHSYAGDMGWLTDLPTGTPIAAPPPKRTPPPSPPPPPPPAITKVPTTPPAGGQKPVPTPTSNGTERESTGVGTEEQIPELPPGAAAGAAAGAGLLVGIGSWLFNRAMGVKLSDLGDLFSSPVEPPPPPAEPPYLLFQEPPHQDGEVNDKGEVWDAQLSGWVGRNLYEQDRQRPLDLEVKAEADRMASRSQDADVKKLYDRTLEDRDTLQRLRNAGVQMEADWTRGDLEELFNKEMRKGPLPPERLLLIAQIWNKIQEAQDNNDYQAGLDSLDQINKLIQAQGRKTYEPVYTKRDLAEDVVMRVGATILDLGGGGGYANASISFIQGARECVRHGADSADAIMEGTKNALLEIATFKVAAVGERLGFNPAKVLATTVGATRGSITMRDALAQGDSLAKAATKGFFDGAFNATATYGIGKLMEKPAAKLSDVVWGPKPTPNLTAVPDDPHVARELANAKRNISIGSDGKKYLDLDDALRLQQKTTVMRTVKQGLADPEVADALKNTLNNLKKTHDSVLVDKIKAKYPELAGEEIRVKDISTPTNKDANAPSVDRDAVVQRRNADGDWVEMPRQKWKNLSEEAFAEVTGHSENPNRFRAGLTPAERARYDAMGKQEQLEFYQEKHQWKMTDKSHMEASRAYSDQRISATGRRTQVSKENININRVKRGEADVDDAEGLGMMARAKISNEVQNNNPSEAFAQAKKEVQLLQETRTGLQARGRDVGRLPENMQKAIKLVETHGDRAARIPKVANQLEAALQEHGFSNIDDFSAKLGSQIGALKIAPQR